MVQPDYQDKNKFCKSSNFPRKFAVRKKGKCFEKEIGLKQKNIFCKWMTYIQALQFFVDKI